MTPTRLLVSQIVLVCAIVIAGKNLGAFLIISRSAARFIVFGWGRVKTAAIDRYTYRSGQSVPVPETEAERLAAFNRHQNLITDCKVVVSCQAAFNPFSSESCPPLSR